MQFTYAPTLLSRQQVIEEIKRCAKIHELTSDDSTIKFYGIAEEIINDPCDTLNHKLPENCLTDANARSDYYYLIADEAASQL